MRILGLMGSTRSCLGLKQPILRTFRDQVDPDGSEYMKNGWESLKGTMTEQFDPILSLLGRYTRSFGSY